MRPTVRKANNPDSMQNVIYLFIYLFIYNLFIVD